MLQQDFKTSFEYGKEKVLWVVFPIIIMALAYLFFVTSAFNYRHLFWANWLIGSRIFVALTGISIAAYVLYSKNVPNHIDTIFLSICQLVQTSHGLLEGNANNEFHEFTGIIFLISALSFRGKFIIWLRYFFIVQASCVILPIIIKQHYMAYSLSETIDKFSFTIACLFLGMILARQSATKYLTLMHNVELQAELLCLQDKQYNCLEKQARQVAHDIQSPLAALNIVTQDLPEVEEEKRLLIRSAVQRIEDIANDLSSKRPEAQGVGFKASLETQCTHANTYARTHENLNPHLISSIIEKIVSEKRMQYRDKQGINISASQSTESYGLFANINAKEFKRVLSNIINNSVEAMGVGGSVVVSMLPFGDGDNRPKTKDQGPKSETMGDCHPCEGRDPELKKTWIPAFAGMTNDVSNSNTHSTSLQSGISLAGLATSTYPGNGLISIKITDTGKGIPAHILPQLMQEGKTFGKEKSEKSGSGLGLYHAKKTMQGWGGDVTIASEEGKGTTVTITLPRQPSPDWFAPEIMLPKGNSDAVRPDRGDPCTQIVILDDDESIHRVWEGRLKTAGLTTVQIVHFKNPYKLLMWKKRQRDSNEMMSNEFSCDTPLTSHDRRNANPNTLYLCDYELLGSDKTGLDVIEELDIAKNAVLVTSHFEEDDVRERCERLGVKLLPKNLAGIVPIRLTANGQRLTVDRQLSAVSKYPIDAILIDDTKMIHTVWGLMAKRCNKTLAHFYEPEDFFEHILEYPTDTPIYIDSNLNKEKKGEEYARDIHSKGFKKIYLATGDAPKFFGDMPWIAGIVGKEPPFGQNLMLGASCESVKKIG